jgi:hypothetical protein
MQVDILNIWHLLLFLHDINQEDERYKQKIWSIAETSKYLTSHFGKALDHHMVLVGETWKQITKFVSDTKIKRI